jgi:hypothetical protein
MERWAIDAKNCLEFLIRSFPADDAKHTVMRESFTKSVEHLNELKDELLKEAHDGLQEAKAPGDECPCATCKTERFLEVLTNLSREQLLEIIATESGINLDTAPCPKNEITTVYEAPVSAGAGGQYGAGKLIKIHDGEDVITVGNPTDGGKN